MTRIATLLLIINLKSHTSSEVLLYCFNFVLLFTDFQTVNKFIFRVTYFQTVNDFVFLVTYFQTVNNFVFLVTYFQTVNNNAGFQERMNFLKEATTMK